MVMIAPHAALVRASGYLVWVSVHIIILHSCRSQSSSVVKICA